MARGTEILLSTNPRGVFMEGYILGTPAPGIVCEIVPGCAEVGGRFQYRPFQSAASGSRCSQFILLPDRLRGKTETDAYATGDHCFLYCPVFGEDMNLLVANGPGTGLTHAVGDMFMVQQGTGQLIPRTSTNVAYWECMEVLVALAAATLVFCKHVGY